MQSANIVLTYLNLPEPALNVLVHGPSVGLEVGQGAAADQQPSDDHRGVRPADRLKDAQPRVVVSK